MVNMRRIGLLGGMSWESSIEYERLINTGVRSRLGGNHSADLIIRSYDFATIEALQQSGAWETAGEMLADDARMLEAAGAEVIVLCTNTMHKVADRIEEALTVRFVHLADATAQAVAAAGVEKVGLLGTRYTMEQDFYRGRLTDRGLKVLVPDTPDRAAVHDVIFGELVKGIISPSSQRLLIGVVDRLVGRGAQGIIAGCTEIELLISGSDVPVHFFPTMRIHAEAVVTAALGEHC